MDSKELRIGNTILYKGVEVNITADDFIEFERNLLDLSKPIPLTEEWLIKFGFGEYFLNDGYRLNNFVLDDDFRFHVIDSTDYGVIVARNIKHVHQLQNLYFALTGKELKDKT